MKVSNQFSVYLVQNHIIAEEDKEIVSFGMEQMGITFVNIVTFLGMGLLLHTFMKQFFFFWYFLLLEGMQAAIMHQQEEDAFYIL